MVDRLEQPAYALHALVTVLDRAADEILKDRLGITYNRFLTLVTLQRLGSATQRELATELGVSEPSVSRALPILAEAGYVSVTTTAGEGNRRQVELTAAGDKLVNEAADLLEDGFAEVMNQAGVKAGEILHVTASMLGALGVGPIENGETR